MFRNTLTLLSLVCFVTLCLSVSHPKRYKTILTIKPDSGEALEVTKLESEKTKEFSWGSRKSGDSRVFRKHDRSRRGSRGTKSLDVYYDGIDKVTEIQLEVTSDNDRVKAKIVKGGVGKDNVKIEITGKDTRFLEYNCEVYGKP